MTTNNNLRPCIVQLGRGINQAHKALFHCWVLHTKEGNQEPRALVETTSGRMHLVVHGRINFMDTKEHMPPIEWPVEVFGA